MIHSTSRAESEERGRGGRVKQSARWFQLRFAQKKKKKKKKPRDSDSTQRGLTLQAAGEAAVSQGGRVEPSG